MAKGIKESGSHPITIAGWVCLLPLRLNFRGRMCSTTQISFPNILQGSFHYHIWKASSIFLCWALHLALKADRYTIFLLKCRGFLSCAPGRLLCVNYILFRLTKRINCTHSGLVTCDWGLSQYSGLVFASWKTSRPIHELVSCIVRSFQFGITRVARNARQKGCESQLQACLTTDENSLNDVRNVEVNEVSEGGLKKYLNE